LSELLERLQSSVLEVAGRGGRERLRIQPFTAFVDHVRTLKYFSFALPDPGVAADAAPALPLLREAFAARDRTARIEHFEALSPDLAGILEAAGWALSERLPLMVCAPADHAAPPAPDGLAIETVGPESSDELITVYHIAMRTGFGDDEPVTEALIERFRSVPSFAVAGRLDGRLVGTANCTRPALGVVEVGGVATLPEYRRRGVAGALTAAAVSAAFAAGAELAWLTAADQHAGRIYERAGFRVAGTQLAHDAV
jgi:GNAT superfamily N-acetyltransferase